MPTVTVKAELTVQDLIEGVAQLTPGERREFMLRFDQLQMVQRAIPGEKAAKIADAHRLSEQDRTRIADLLEKNREQGLSPEEESELDVYMQEMDQQLGQVTDELMALAQH